MAVLTPKELTEHRRAVENIASPAWTKGTINRAAQAIEDEKAAIKTALNVAIDTATSPVVLPPPVKIGLVNYALRRRGG